VEAFQLLSPRSLYLLHHNPSVTVPAVPSGHGHRQASRPSVRPPPPPDGLPTVGTGDKRTKRHGRKHHHVGPLQKPKQPDRVQLGRSSVAQAWAGGGSEQHARLDPPNPPPPQSVGQSVSRPGVPADRKRRRKKEVDGQAGGRTEAHGDRRGLLLLRPFFFLLWFILFCFVSRRHWKRRLCVCGHCSGEPCVLFFQVGQLVGQ
jgi:hypothetical protein